MRKRLTAPLYCKLCGTEQKRPKVVICQNQKCAEKDCFTNNVSEIPWNVLMTIMGNQRFLRGMNISPTDETWPPL